MSEIVAWIIDEHMAKPPSDDDTQYDPCDEIVELVLKDMRNSRSYESLKPCLTTQPPQNPPPYQDAKQIHESISMDRERSEM
jgi:hypothetical protein